MGFSLCVSLQMFPKHHRTEEDAAVGGAGEKREEGVCLKHLRKAEDPILVMLGLNPMGRDTGQGCGKDLTSNLHVGKILYMWLASVQRTVGQGSEEREIDKIGCLGYFFKREWLSLDSGRGTIWRKGYKTQ